MPWLRWLFWSHTTRRLRAGWRILIHLACFFYTPPLLNWAVGVPAARILAALLPALAPVSDRLALQGIRLLAILGSTWLIVRFIDRRAWSELGFQFDRAWWVDLGFGLGLGALLMSFVFWTQYAAGWVKIRAVWVVTPSSVPFAIMILGPVTVFLVVGITEELLARGYQLRNLSEGFNGAPFAPQTAILVSWVISSSLFGLLHIFNPNATWLSILYLMLAGLFLGLGAVLTGRLGLPIGVHITWNLFQGSVYGFPVSGNLFPSARVLVIEQGGPPVWTGSAFGPEAGLIGIAAILLGCLCTLAWVQYRYRTLRVYRPLADYRPIRAPIPPAVEQATP